MLCHKPREHRDLVIQVVGYRPIGIVWGVSWVSWLSVYPPIRVALRGIGQPSQTT
jgi:hypothetical protein